MGKGRRRRKGALWIKILFFVVIFVLAAVIYGRGGKDEEEETLWQEGSMLRVGDTQVDYREGMIYLDAVRRDYEQYYGSDIWQYAVDSQGNTMGELIKNQVLEQIIYVKVVCQKADELGIVLTEEELLHVEDQTAEYMRSIQDSNLLLYGVNADIARRIYSDNLLARKTFEVTTLNVDTEISDEEVAQHRFQTIAIRNFKIDASGNRVSYEETEREELLGRIASLREQALTSDDFYKLALANTEDSTMLEVVGGAGDFPAAYEDIIFSLKTGEVSEIVETTDYIYIFYCVSDFDVDATHEKKEEIIAERQESEFQSRYKEWRDAIRIEINESVWESLDFSTEAEG